MFLCEFGGHTTDPGEGMVKIITATRVVEYHNKVKVMDEFGVYHGVKHVVSKGTEIVSEISSCQKCIDNNPLKEGWILPDEQITEVIEQQ